MKRNLNFAASLAAILGLAAVYGALTITPAQAQGRAGMSWSGRVDNDVIVYIHQDNARTDTLSGRSTDHIRTDFWGRLPDRPVQVYLENRQGRGVIRVIQQPRPDNGFTAGVEIRDPQAGYGDYNFTLGWSRPMGWRGRAADGF